MVLNQSVYSQKRSDKRGVAYDIPYIEDLPTLAKGVSWFYNWGIAPRTDVINQEYLDFVPMAWNKGYNVLNLRTYLTAHPNVKYILGFNEPNFTAQANIGPAAAAAAWPALEAIANEFNLKIVGPALNYAPGGSASVTENGINYTDPFKYYDAFFAACPTCRVDYVAAHTYMNDPIATINYVNQYITKYKKQVWLTEFCAWDGLSKVMSTGYPYQKQAMIRKIEDLELNPMVARYAWFIPRSNNEIAYPFNELLRSVNIDPTYELVAPGILTELGKIYVNMSSFDSAHYYGMNEQIPAKDYMKSYYVNIEASTDLSSTIPIQLYEFEGGLFVEYFVDVPAAGQYPLTLRIANTAGVSPSFTISSNGTVLTTQEVASSGGQGNWQVRTFPITLSAGKQTIRITSNGISGCKMQWFSFSSTADIVETQASHIHVFVDTNNMLQISCRDKVTKATILDISGKVLLQETNEQEINVAALDKGVYILKVKLESGNTLSSKFFINK